MDSTRPVAPPSRNEADAARRTIPAVAVISRSWGYLFLLSPRTGCTAIARGVLLPELDGSWIPAEEVVGPDGRIVVRRKHTSLAELRRHGLLSRQDVRRLLVFSTVRNPYDSLVSHWAKLRTQWRKEAERDASSWVHRSRGTAEIMALAAELDFSDWLVAAHRGSWRHPWSKLRRDLPAPHHMYGEYLAGTDVVLRHEQLQEDFDRVLAQLGAPRIEIPTINASAGRDGDYRRYYTEPARELATWLFRPDLERFGYRF